MISMEECFGSHNVDFVIQRRGLFNEEQNGQCLTWVGR